jgi:hypothetical protein
VASGRRAPPRRRLRRSSGSRGPPQLAVLALQLLYAGALGGRQAGPLALVDLGLADPQSDRLRSDAERLRDTGDRALALALLGRNLADQADGALSQLRRIPPLGGMGTPAALCHDSIFLQRMESPQKSVRFSLSIVDSNAFEMGPGSRTGHLTVFRALRRTSIRAAARLGNWDWTTTARALGFQAADAAEHKCFTLGRVNCRPFFIETSG